MEEKHVILDKKEIARDTFYVELRAPLIAQKAQAGQFAILRIAQAGERIPLTIASTDKVKGTISIVFLRVGYSTAQLARLKPGETIEDVLGPLGHATDLREYKSVFFVGGGVGIAELYPVVSYYHSLPGGRAVIIIGAKSKEYLFWIDQFQRISGELIVCTDDGSMGKKGLVTDALAEALAKDKTIDLVYAVGPIAMMDKVSQAGRKFNKKTIVSLNSIMVDGTGMCGSCRITYKGKTKFVCVDGPDFDAADVDFEELKQRSRFFKEHECALTQKLEKPNNG
jgi:ferredoxin--NADP+ reductase